MPLVWFWQKWPRAENPLRDWYRLTREATWRNFTEVKATFGQTDQAITAKGNAVVIFDIGGNKFRLIAAIHYNTQKVFVLRVLTHKEYDTELWKRQL
jgi:mRNA interferase HigB